MISMTYTIDFQVGLLSALLVDEGFCADTMPNLHISDFELSSCRLIFEIARNYYVKHRRAPPFSVLQIEVARAVSDPTSYLESSVPESEYESLVGVMQRIALTRKETVGVEFYREELRNFICHVRVSQARALARPAHEEMAEIISINNQVNSIGAVDTEFIGAMDRQPEEDPEMLLRWGTGLRRIDRIIGGGISRREMGILVACTGIGKTTGMLNFACNAAIADKYSLFITLENPRRMIVSRYQGIMTNVSAKWADIPEDEWPDDVRKRMEYGLSADFRYGPHVTVVDKSERQITMAELEQIVIKWKRYLESKGVPPEKILLVYVDWLAQLSTSGVPGVTRNSGTPEVRSRMSHEMAAIGRRQNVTMWTSAQGTREAVDREVIAANHVAESFHVLDGADLAVGLARVKAEDDDNNTANDDDEEMPECDRLLNVSVIKGRNCPTLGKWRDVYQGPTLRLWESVDQAAVAMRQAENLQFDDLYMSMQRQELRAPAGRKKR